MATQILSAKTEWQALLQPLFYEAYMGANVLHYCHMRLLENISNGEDVCKIFYCHHLPLQT